MRKPIICLSVLLLGALLLAPTPLAVASRFDDGRVGAVLDIQGAALVSPAGRDRWTPLTARSLLMPGDRVRTLVRGANALEIALASGGRVVLGPGALATFTGSARIELHRGEGEFTGTAKTPLSIGVAGGARHEVKDAPLLLGATRTGFSLPRAPFPWLVGYRASTTGEWMGSLVAKVDGRNTPLTIGYHKVSVVIRDQIAETTVEESFVNSTSSVLEGTFSFPLPADASIGGFGMWIGDELVMADIVERQKARAIYEDILRRKKDPGLLEWSGGNLFKARVFPIPARGEKRIKIRYTQALPLEGTKLRYRYALRSELLRANPVRKLSIRVRMLSAAPIAAAGSPSHEVATDATAHEVLISYDAEEVTPERDFEAEFDLAQVRPLTVLPHRRGPDGYFLLLLSPPDPAAAGLTRELSPEGDPVDLLLFADTSGSMDQADRDTQAAFLESLLSLLGEKDTFRLCAMDRDVTWHSEEPLPATEQNAADALAFLAARDSLGWTDVDRAVAEAIGRAGEGSHVVFVGDGIGTARDPDPAALVRRIDRAAKNARGTFHAVAAGSSYEQSVLEAIAAIGGGSVREAASDPADAAYRLLAEAASPVVKDLRVSFEGVRTARVYPERLPNLPAGRQQAILGRYLPSEESRIGQVTVTGTMAGEEVRYTAIFVMDVNDSGNSFLPRLWARRHVDALMKEALTEEVKDEIVGKSAEFGIMTPLTSFLVLESDADRERYGVTRRVAMRDGERFFAEAKDRVDTEMLREAMKNAGLWRANLRGLALDEIAGLGRNLVVAAYGHRGGGSRPASGPGGGISTRSSSHFFGESSAIEDPVIMDAKVSDHNETDNDMPFEESLGERDFISDAPFDGPVAGERQPRSLLAGGELSAPEQLAKKSIRLEERILLSPVREAGRLRRMFMTRSEMEGRGRTRGAARRILTLFPRLPAAPRDLAPLPTPDWPADVRDILDSLDRTEEIDALGGGIEIDVTSVNLHPLRGTVTNRNDSRSLFSSGAWLVRETGSGRLPTVRWCDGKTVGIYREGARTGRRRPSAANDLKFSRALPGFYSPAYARSFPGWKAEVVERDGDRVTIRFLEPRSGREARLVIDTKRRVTLEETWVSKGRPTARKVWSGWTEVAGLPFPGLTERYDEKDRLNWRSETKASVRTEEEIGKKLLQLAFLTKDEVFLPAADPSLEAAKQAVHTGKAGFADRLVILVDHAERQQWDAALSEWERAKMLVEEASCPRFVEAALLSISRRGEALAERLPQLAASVAGEGESTEGLADLVYGFAQGTLGQTELVALTRTLRDAVAESGATDRAVLFDRRLAGHLEQAGRPREALAIRQRLVEDHPEDPSLVRGLAVALRAGGRSADAIRLLDEKLMHLDVWLPDEANSVFDALADYLWNARRREEFLAATEAWIEKCPEREAPRQRRYAGLLQLGRVEEVDGEVLAILAEPLPEVPTPWELARLGAAIETALGRTWNFRASGLDEMWHRPLGEAAVRLGRRDDAVSRHSMRILRDWRFRWTDAGRRALAELLADLLDPEMARGMSVDRLRRLAGLFLSAGESATEKQSDALVEIVLDRWTRAEDDEERRVLGDLLVNLFDRRGDAESAMALLRRRMAVESADQRPSLANRLLQRIMNQPASPAVEAEVFSLMPRVVPEDRPPAYRSRAFVALAGYVADGLHSARTKALMSGANTDKKLSRTEQRARTRDASRLARIALASVFAERARTAVDDLRPWLAIEGLSFAAEAGDDLAALEGRVREALLSPPGLAAPDLFLYHAARASLILDYIALRSNAPEGLPERVLALHLERAAEAEGQDERERRYELFRFLLALDRPDELAARLAEWIAIGKPSGYRIALAHLLAERGDLAAAAKMLEEVAAQDELDTRGYVTLASWHLALGEDGRYRVALDRSYELTPERDLGRRIRSEYSRVRGTGPDGVPPDLDPEIVRIEEVLFAKATDPSRYVNYVRNLYRTTKDFRLVAAIADGIVGHSPERIYPLLSRCAGLLGEVHEEATLDEVSARIRASVPPTATDMRGLLYLLALVERRAAEVKNRPELHGERALPALRAAFRTELAPGEGRHVSEFLAKLGRIPVEPLAAEQLRQLETIHAGADLATEDGLSIAVARATTLWAYDRHDEALDVLANALDACRRASGGRLPATAFVHLAMRVAWLEGLSRYGAGEAVLLDERGRQEAETAKAWMTVRLFYLHTLALENGGAVSIGEGEALYHCAFEIMEAAVFTLPPGRVDDGVRHLAGLCATAAAGPAKGATEDLAAFARTRLREALTRAPDQEQSLWLHVAETVRTSGDPATGLALLVEKMESDPKWYARYGRDGWRRFAQPMARMRATDGVKGELAERLAKIVVAELEAELVNGENRGHAFYHRGNRYFWKERREEFAAAARKVVELRADSPAIVLRCAEYLWGGLNLQAEAVDVLADLDARGTLTVDGRFRLGLWLQELDRHAEAVIHFENILGANPDRLDARVRLVRSLHATDRDEEGKTLVDAGGARLREMNGWVAGNIQPLADACFECGWHERSARYFEELVLFYEKGRDRWSRRQLARNYGLLARSLVSLGKEDEAVAAAGAAVVVFGDRSKDRARALEALRAVLAGLSDLDGFVARHDEEVAKTGLDAPVIRKALGEVYLGRKEWQEATVQLSAARELSPVDGEVHEMLVAARDAAGDTEGGTRALLDWVRTSPSDLDLLARIAVRLAKTGKKGEAERALTGLAEVSPLEAEGHRMLADRLSKDRRFEEALIQRRVAKRQRAYDPDVWFELVKTLRSMGRGDDANVVLTEMISREWRPEFEKVAERASKLLRE